MFLLLSGPIRLESAVFVFSWLTKSEGIYSGRSGSRLEISLRVIKTESGLCFYTGLAIPGFK